MKTIQIQKKRRKTMSNRYYELLEVGFTVKEIAEMMGFGICLVRDYYNNYRNLTQGTHYYIHSKRKNKS